MVALLTLGGAIPARRYTFSTFVRLRLLVMERHASLRVGSSLLTCFNLSPTGEIAVVLMVARWLICSSCLLYHVIFNFQVASRFLRRNAHVCVLSGFTRKFSFHSTHPDYVVLQGGWLLSAQKCYVVWLYTGCQHR